MRNIIQPAQFITTIKLVLYFAIVSLIQSCGSGQAETKPDAMISPDKTPPIISAVNSTTSFAEMNGRKLAYRSIGKGEAMILCQRYRGNLDDWDPAFLDALAKTFSVVIFDYSGFGLSTGTPPSSMIGFANDVKDLAKSLGHQKIIVGGWSFGGAVAQIATTEFPDLVSSTILLGTRPPGLFKHAPEKIFLETSAKPINDFEDEIILFFEPSSEISKAAAQRSHDRIAQRKTDKDVYIKQDLWQFYLKGFEDYTKDPYNSRQKLSTTKTPILVISADHEVVFPPENWFELNRKLPTAQVVVIPQTGHGPHHQYPEMVADYINSFITNSKNL